MLTPKKKGFSRMGADLERLPNVGPSTAGDLRRVDVRRIEDLVGLDPDRLYERLCERDGVRHDPCVRDVLESAIRFAEGGPPYAWWFFSRRRKAREAAALRKGSTR
jgi:hypothetical protein